MKYIGVLACNYIQCKLSWKLLGNIPCRHCGDMYCSRKMYMCVCLGGIYGEVWEPGTKCLTYHKGYKEITYPFVVTPPPN